jgi:hypothetical protein
VSPLPQPGLRALHVFVLASLASAPVLVVTDAQFFVGRGATGGEIVAAALIVVLAAPAALALAGLLVSLASDRLGWVVHLVLIGVLCALILSEALYPLGLRIEVQAPVVIAAGAALALAYARREGIRSALSSLVVLPVVILGFVFLATPVSGLVFASEPEAVDVAGGTARTPVVVVVFDEFAGHALMDRRGRLDEERFPAFARLGQDATWFPRATSSRSDTELAVPTVATGRSAPLESLPTASDHPESIFTLLGATHEMHVSEPWTGLCPKDLCEGSTESTREGGLGGLLETIPQILGYVAVPDAERIGIPGPRESSAISRRAQFGVFTEEIEGSEEPALHFLHTLLPHKAWRYLPSGDVYEDSVGADSELGGLEAWPDDPWFVLQHEQRFLLQLQFTDRLLGNLLDRLRSTGIYDEALIVVTADHGVAFRAGEERRDATPSNAADILSVPLFVKEPGQRNGRVSDAPARTIDVLPTVADVLEIDVPWELDGRSLLGEVPARAVAVENLRGGAVELTEAEYEAALDRALARRLETLGSGNSSLYAIGPKAGLHGDRVAGLVGQPADGQATVIDGDAIRSYDPRQDPVPARIAGSLDAVEPGAPLALALRGRVAATTHAYAGDYRTEFAAMIPPRLLEAGDNELELFLIEGEDGDATLRPLDVGF